MKSEDFYQIVNTSLYLYDKISNLKDILHFINKVRLYHIKLQDKLEYLLIDPTSFEKKEERELINSMAIEIRDVCKECEIQCNFIKIPDDYSEFSNNFRENKQFVNYWYNKVNITNLIVFVKKKKESKEKKKENSLSLLKLTEKDFDFPENKLDELDNIKLE